MLLEQIFPKHIVANAIILFAFVFYIFLFYKIKVFKPVYFALKKNKIFFLLIFLILLLLSFFNGWRTYIYYDEPEQITNSIFVSKHFLLGKTILPRPFAFPVFLSFFNNPLSYYYSQFVGRLISFLATFLSAVILFRIYENLGVKKWMNYGFTFLFSMASYNIFYLTLNKPEAFAVFFILFFINLFWEYSFENKKENFWILYFLSLFLPLIRYELIIISFSFSVFLFFKAKHHNHLFLTHFIFMITIFMFSYSLFSGINSAILGPNHKLFYLSKLSNSFILKMILSPWILFFVLFFAFVFKGIAKSSNKKQRWFFNMLLLSFVLLSVVYSFYSYSEQIRYQKLLYPFLFVGLAYVKNIKMLFKNKKVSIVILIFLIVIYSCYFLQSYRQEGYLQIGSQSIFLNDEVLSDLYKNAKCFNDSIVYTYLDLTKLLYDFNFVSLSNKDTTFSEVFIQESRYKNIEHYICLWEYFTYYYGPLSRDELQVKVNSTSNFHKLSQLCPGLNAETKRHLIYLDRPLSEYIKN